MNLTIPYQTKVDIATVLIFIFMIVGVVVFIAIFIIKNQKTAKKIRKTRFETRAESLMNNIIIDFEEATPDQIQKLERDLLAITKHKWQKDLLADILIHYQINLSGQVEILVKKLFFDLELHLILEKDLDHGSLTRKIRAMRYLSEIRHNKAWIKIINFINDDRKLLRVEASFALVFLTKNPLFFLNSLEKKITLWQQIGLYHRLKELELNKIPDFSQWFTSENPSVVDFSLEMTSKFNQVDSKEESFKLLNHDNNEIKIKAIETLSNLEAFEYSDLFVTYLKTYENDNVEIELLKTIGNISLDKTHIDILDEYLISPNFNIRFHAAKAMLQIEGGKERLDQFQNQRPELLTSIVAHLSNALLS